MTDQTTYRAKWLVIDPWTTLEDGYVQVVDNVIRGTGSGRPPAGGPVKDLGSGALIPPLVNAHTHLELSALRASIPVDKGFRHWVSVLLQKRAALSETDLLSGIADAIKQLLDSGCRLVGDISTLGITQRQLFDSKLSGIIFQEHLGENVPETGPVEKSLPFSTSLAGHAPHTTAPLLLKHIKKKTSSRGLPMSIHLAESKDECLFITTGKGKWADFLTERGIDFSSWPLPAKSPVEYLHTLGVLDDATIAVHLICCSAEDIDILKNSRIAICFCPRSNYLLHERLPDIPHFLANGFKPCLGTDSLASSPSLRILDEMAFFLEKYPGVSPIDIFAMGSVYGADTLGMGDRFGRLAPGFTGPPFYVSINTDNPSCVIEAVISSGKADVNRTSEKLNEIGLTP